MSTKKIFKKPKKLCVSIENRINREEFTRKKW